MVYAHLTKEKTAHASAPAIAAVQSAAHFPIVKWPWNTLRMCAAEFGIIESRAFKLFSNPHPTRHSIHHGTSITLIP